ncbi:MAG TPA: GNAT family N-acetyltransferase [Acidimicrobiales bacterium]
MDARRAGPDDLPAVATTLAGAFAADPAWTWVFPDPARRPDQLRAYWMLLLEGAVDLGWVWATPDAGAATLWIPPGEPELAPTQAARADGLWEELLGPDVWRSTLLGAAFEAAHPTTPGHYYLSLFGTRPDRRGRGLGMALLADNLARIDAEGVPAYLESTNPANLDRYRSVGFVDHGEFALGDAGPVVTTMWREPHPTA